MGFDACLLHDAGSSYTGDGTIYQDGDAMVYSPTTIDVGIYDMDGFLGDPSTIQLLDDLTLNVDAIDTVSNRFSDTIILGPSTTLTVNTPNPWEMAGTLKIDSQSSEFGRAVAGQRFEMSGTMNLLFFGSPNNVSVGAAVDITGQINLTNLFARLRLEGGDLASPNTIDGGTYVGQTFDLDSSGILTVSTAEATINTSDGAFCGGSATTLDSSLRLVGSHIAHAAASFDGPGSLVVDYAGTLQIEGGEIIGVAVVNEGMLEPGLSTGSVTVAEFTQTATGTLRIELGGLIAGAQFDVLNATGAATLAGTLDVTLIDFFVPDDGQSFQILTAVGGLGGTEFDTELLPALPGDLMWNVDYAATIVTLEVFLNAFLEADFGA